MNEARSPAEINGHMENVRTVAARGGDAISFVQFLRILQRGKRTIFIAGLSTLLLATVLAFHLPLSYIASSSFLLPDSNTGASAADTLTGQLSAPGGGPWGSKMQGDIELYAGILRSRSIAHDLVQQFDLKRVYNVKKESQAEKILATRSFIEVGAKDLIVTIHVTDKSPERARDLANGYLQALQATMTDLSLAESSQQRAFYGQWLAKQKSDLDNAEDALKQDEEKTGLIAPSGQTASEIQTLAQLRAQITGRQVRLAAMLRRETGQNPDVVLLRNEIGTLQAQVDQIENGENKGHSGRFSTAQIPGLELGYIRNLQDVKYHEALFNIIARQYAAAHLDDAKYSALEVLDRATAPDKNSGPHRFFIMAIGFLDGLLGGSAWVLLTERPQH